MMTVNEATVQLATTAMTCLTFAYCVSCIYRYSIKKLDVVQKPFCERKEAK